MAGVFVTVLGVGPYRRLNKGFEQWVVCVAINRAVPYRLGPIVSWRVSFSVLTNTICGLPKFRWAEAFSPATYGMFTTECRRKDSTHGRRTSMRDARRRLTAGLVCRALSLKQKEHVEELDDRVTYWVYLGIKEEVTALGIKEAGHSFRQDIVFFVDGLPPTPTPTPLGCRRRRLGCSATAHRRRRTWRRVTRRIKGGSLPWPKTRNKL